MSNLLKVSSNPHVRDRMKTDSIMLLVLIALIPASAFGVWNFGINALMVILVSVITCVLTEYIYEKLMHRKVTIGDLSAAVTGLLLALNLPSTVPFWIPMVGGVFAIIFVKQLFGGLGQNFMNPALGARCFLLISFTGRMTNFAYDGVTILIGAIVLLWFEVIDLRIPGTYILSFAVFTLLFGGHGLDWNFLLAQLCGGGLMLGAFFMATDYVTSPITKTGQLLYGVFLGLLTAIFRFLGNAAEGVSYAIIIGNLLVPLIEKCTQPTAFGKDPIWKRRKNA